MSSKEEQEGLIQEAEQLIQQKDYDGAISKLAGVDHPDLQDKRDFLIAQAQRQGR